MKNLLYILSFILFSNLNAQNKRIAVSCDGNIHDRDDICAVSIELGIIAKSNLQSQIVYFGYGDHWWQTNTAQQTDEANSVINSANSWGGFNMSRFIDVQKNHTTAVNMLVAEINKSSASDVLVIAALGPMQVVGEAIKASDATKRQYVTVVSHSAWNNEHAGNTGASEGLSLPRYNLDATNNTGSGTTFISNLGVKITKIKDQNNTVSAPYSSYTWLQTASDTRLNLMWTECRTVANKSNFDCSDAGVLWYIIKNDQDGSPSKLQTFFAGAVVSTPPPSTGVYYVSSSDGNDGNNGTSPGSAWRTLSKVNSFAGNLNAGNQVLFKRGDTFFGAVTFTSGASGTASSPVIIGAYGSGNKPVITGLQSLSFGGGSGNIYTSSAINPQSKPKLLLINGQLTAIGRWPNANAANGGYLEVTSVNSNRSANTTDVTDSRYGSYSKPTSDFNGGQIAYRQNRFTFTTQELTSSTSGGTFHLHFLEAAGTYGYFIQNHIACLDQNTEWCYNSNNTTSIYLTSSPSGMNIQMPVIDRLFSVSASYITIQDLAFSGANMFGISASGANVKIQNCDFTFCGHAGSITTGSNAVVSGNTYNNIMKYGHQSKNGSSTVTDNEIRNINPILGMGEGGNTGGSGMDITGSNHTVQYNKIYNVAYAGVNFHDGSNVFIRYNIVDGYCMRLDDGGAFYTVAQNRDFTFRNKHVNNNIIRHGENPSSLIGAFENNIQTYALYNDQWSNNIDWSNNVSEGGYSGWFANDPINDIVNNNLFYNIKGNNVKISNKHSDYAITGNTFSGNVFFSNATSGSTGMWISKISSGSLSGYGTFNGNYYVRPYNNGSLFHTEINGSKNDYTLPQWKGTGYGFESSAALSPKTFTATSNPVATYTYYVVNDTKQPKTIPLTGEWVSAKNFSYIGSITLQPFTAEVLLWGTGGTPPPVTPPIEPPGPVTPPDPGTPQGVLKAKTKFIIVNKP